MARCARRERTVQVELGNACYNCTVRSWRISDVGDSTVGIGLIADGVYYIFFTASALRLVCAVVLCAIVPSKSCSMRQVLPISLSKTLPCAGLCIDVAALF
jgi:hypothetical protein